MCWLTRVPLQYSLYVFLYQSKQFTFFSLYFYLLCRCFDTLTAQIYIPVNVTAAF